LCRPGIHAVGAGGARRHQARRPAENPRRVRCALRAPLRAPFARRAGRDGQYPACGHRQARDAEISETARRENRSETETPRRLSRRPEQALVLSDLPACRSRRRRAHHGPGADRGARQDHGAVQRRQLPGGAVGRTDHRRRRRVMAKSRKQASKRKRRKALDAVTLEVIRNALPAIANEMAADLQRTSYNMMIYEVRDFCTSLVNTKGELISQNVGGVSHFVADLGVLITDAMARFGAKGFAPGDVVITNHQAVAGQHLNNIVIYMPYFHKGELLMFAMVRAHWIDVGGMSTGFGAGPTVKDPWEEGLQLDQLKIYERGKLTETLYRVLKDNIRFPESSLGDMKSQMAACRLAGR